MVSPRDTSSFAHFRKKTKYFDMLTIDTEKSCLRLLNPSPHSQSLIHESQEPAGKSFQRHHFWCTTYLCLKIQVFIPSSTKQFWQKSQCKSYLGWMKMTVWMTYPKSSPSLPEAKRSVLRSDAIDVIQLSSGILSSELPSGLLWAFGTVHNGFFFETLHRESELLAKWN